jgi:hypothetical protein
VTLRACGTHGSHQCSKSRYKVVVLYRARKVVSGRIESILGEENVLVMLGFASATNCFVSS